MSDPLAPLLAEVKAGKVRPLYLCWGEEFLVRRDAEALAQAVVPEAATGLNFAVLDVASPREIAAELMTLPLFPGRKVALVRDPEFLAPKKGRVDALGKVREAWKAGRRKESARRLLALVARAGWGVAEVDPSVPGAPPPEAWKEELGITLADADLDWLREMVAFIREERVTAPESDASPLLAALERGLPEGHALIIATTDVDPRHPLLKVAQKQGVVMERKVGGRFRDLDLSGAAKSFLEGSGKRLGPGAEEALRDRLGGQMRLLQSELEKLVAYVQGPLIRREDVEQLVARVREEEFLELSDALQKRDLAAALRYVDEALEHGAAPLMILGAIASVVRGLIESHERMTQLGRGQLPRSFDEFKSRIFPGVEREAKQHGQRVPHPWAAFLGMQAAARYGRPALRRGLLACAEADVALKSSGGGKLVLERLLWTVCPPGRVPA
ncbi:MAG: DNA polymerase III subunit delta [Myxococcaceae bacterium]